MKMLDLIQEYHNKLQTNPHDISCLLFALQIPSICSRIEFPQTPENTGRDCNQDKILYRNNGKVWDANMYKAWLKKYKSYFENIYSSSMTTDAFSNNLYELRNQVTHEGILMSEKNKFYFIESNSMTIIDDIVFIPIKRLCEKMFDVAHNMLSNHHEVIDITLFDDVFIPSEVFNQISNDALKIYHSFWDNRPKDDNILNIIYDHIIFNKPYMKDSIDKFFTETPDAVFEIWDFGYKFGYIVDIEERFIHKDYDESKSFICRDLKTDTDVLRLNKQQYEQMITVAMELADFSNRHPFDITKYIVSNYSKNRFML